MSEPIAGYVVVEGSHAVLSETSVYEHFCDDARDFRGGVALLREIAASSALHCHWVQAESDEIVAFLLANETEILTVHVGTSYRRKGLATALVDAARARHVGIVDARCLPGDRASKSLYEAFGWKARQIVMTASAGDDESSS